MSDDYVSKLNINDAEYLISASKASADSSGRSIASAIDKIEEFDEMNFDEIHYDEVDLGTGLFYDGNTICVDTNVIPSASYYNFNHSTSDPSGSVQMGKWGYTDKNSFAFDGRADWGSFAYRAEALDGSLALNAGYLKYNENNNYNDESVSSYCNASLGSIAIGEFTEARNGSIAIKGHNANPAFTAAAAKSYADNHSLAMFGGSANNYGIAIGIHANAFASDTSNTSKSPFAFGRDVTAEDDSFAFGHQVSAAGEHFNLAIGHSTTAIKGSIAVGEDAYAYSGSVALGPSTIARSGSVAIKGCINNGWPTTMYSSAEKGGVAIKGGRAEEGAFAFGPGSYACQGINFQIGTYYNTNNNPGYSTAYQGLSIGNKNQVTGGFVIGHGLKANSVGLVIGQYNKTSASMPFVIGGGSADNNRKDLLTVNSNGVVSAYQVSAYHDVFCHNVALTELDGNPRVVNQHYTNNSSNYGYYLGKTKVLTNRYENSVFVADYFLTHSWSDSSIVSYSCGKIFVLNRNNQGGDLTPSTSGKLSRLVYITNDFPGGSTDITLEDSFNINTNEVSLYLRYAPATAKKSGLYTCMSIRPIYCKNFYPVEPEEITTSSTTGNVVTAKVIRLT